MMPSGGWAGVICQGDATIVAVCIYFKILNGSSISNMTLIAMKDIHRYNTRIRNSLRLPAVKT